jgi:hypothetical protein
MNTVLAEYWAALINYLVRKQNCSKKDRTACLFRKNAKSENGIIMWNAWYSTREEMISKLVFTAVRILEGRDINSSCSMTSAERSRKAPSNIPNDTSTLPLYFTFINIYNTYRAIMTAKASEIELRHRPLKVLYPEVELRKKYQ